MATMTTRILDTGRTETIVTLLLALGVPCSAQLGVILGCLQDFHGTCCHLGRPDPLSFWLWSDILPPQVVREKALILLWRFRPLRIPQLSNVAVQDPGPNRVVSERGCPAFHPGTLILFRPSIRQGCSP